MIDERDIAIAVGFALLGDGVPDNTPAGPLLEAFKRAIEAYEAARPEPNPWRPIAEAPRDGSWILVLVDDYTFPPGMIQWNGDAWVDNDLDCWDLDFLLRERAMFRTIDPPKQDVAQSAVDSAPAAGTG